MATSEAGSCIDAAPASQGEYDVFLNFRGVDTRHGFTDFLYHGLKDAGIHVFRDEEKLPIGEVISEKLQQAIKNAIIYIPIFSQTYVSSKWCLRELALMVDNMSKSKDKKSIIPIFFHVEPDDVKFKKPLYEADFKKHEEDFPDEVKAWKGALRKVGEHKGRVVKKNTSQAMIVKSIVEKVLEKLKIKRKLVTEHLIPLDDRVKKLAEFLDVNHDDVRLIGIYGMGGIGKTTLAKAVFNHLYSHFGRSCSFLEDIRERSTKEGIVPLQKKLLSDIGGSEYVEKIYDGEEGMRRIGATLSNRKVLVVLDDVDKKVPIKNLIVNSKLSRGSRIIITTRDKDIPQVEESEVKIERYEMQTMDDGVALQLFCLHAFQKDYPLDDYRELSREILSLMGGLPLAIKVVGSLLKSKKDKKIWKDTLLKLRAVPKEEILEKLRISYNDLDKFQKEIFLDIACFFFNEKKTDAIYMWESCKFYPREGIEVLTERCLIKILDNDKFWMHDQLIALGRQIVREDSQGDFGKQSRLWDPKEALQIIRTKEEKNEIQALEIHGLDGSMEITNEEFERLQNLRFLNLGDGTFAGDFAKSHSKLRWISWHPDLRAEYMYLNQDLVFNNMYLDDLVVFKLGTNHFMGDSKAWDLIKRAQNLKVLSLTGCHGISTIPDISKCSSLERLILTGCSSLKRIESFIGNLPSLIELKIEGCRDLTDLPKEIGALVKLEHFSLSGCEMLRELPRSIENLTSLTELDLSDTIISKLPDSIGKLKSLRILRFPVDPLVGGEKHDWQLPSGISTLVNFEELDLSGHEELKGEIPIGIEEWSSLRILNLESTSICRIPSTINMLHHLQTLNLGDCHEIQELPELPTSLTCLHLESESLLSVPNLCKHTNLVELQLSDGSRLTRNSNLRTGCNISWIGSLSKMKELDLNLQNVPVPPELASLSHLEELVLSFVILDCKVADILLEGLPRLEKLTVDNCKQLKTLSIPLKLRKLREVHVVWCKELLEIQVVGLLESLEHLRVYECESLKGISGLSYLKNLETLRIEMCNVLPDVEGLDKLESLKFLDVKKCMSLRSLIDASCTNIPDDCYVIIEMCGDSIKDCLRRKPLKDYREEVLQNTSTRCDILFINV